MLTLNHERMYRNITERMVPQIDYPCAQRQRILSARFTSVRSRVRVTPRPPEKSEETRSFFVISPHFGYGFDPNLCFFSHGLLTWNERTGMIHALDDTDFVYLRMLGKGCLRLFLF